MKFILKTSILIFVVLFLVVCKKEQNEEVMPQKNEIDKQTQLKIIKNNNLSIKLFKSEVTSSLEDKNIISFHSFFNTLKTSKNAALNFEIKSKYQDKEVEIPFYYNPSKSSFVEMISSKYYFNFYSDKNFKLIEIPLKETKYNMHVIIPNNNKSLLRIINKLNSSFLNKIYSKTRKNKMQVILPKFQIKYTSKQVKKNMLKSIKFRVKNNDKIKHSFFSNEDENSYKTLFINRPFIFIISEKATNAILFIGKVNNPLS